jgi:hypothetical protein
MKQLGAQLQFSMKLLYMTDHLASGDRSFIKKQMDLVATAVYQLVEVSPALTVPHS